MKKRFLALILCLCMLGGLCPAYAAGTSADPLISLSYLDGTFTPVFVNNMREMIRLSLASAKLPEAVKTGPQRIAVSAGGSVKMSTGQTIIVLSGKARVEMNSGAIVNATMGAQAGSGGLNLNSRYIMCEDADATVNIIEDCVLIVSSGAAVTQGDGKVSPFRDVKRGEWYFDDVISAYERGLVNGMTTTTYVPGGTLTAGQAVKLAACMHQLYHEGKVSLSNSPSGTHWYRSYVDYALENGILEQEFADYDAIIVRQRFVELFYRALPLSEYNQINSIPDGAIPDVAMTDPNADIIYTFYRAGILTGYANDPRYEDGAFGSGSITRAEVATIINRMFDRSARQSFTLE